MKQEIIFGEGGNQPLTPLKASFSGWGFKIKKMGLKPLKTNHIIIKNPALKHGALDYLLKKIQYRLFA